jgi:putative membrane protein
MSSDTAMNNPFETPSRQSPAALAIIIMRFVVRIIRQFWPVVLILLLRGRSGTTQWWVYAGLGAGGVVMILSLLAYFRTWFHVEHGEMVLNRGGLFRKLVQVPLDKIQTVSFQQTFLHRLLNVVSVSIDTSSGKGSEIELLALDRAKAEALRTYLLSRQHQAAPISGDVVMPETPSGANDEKILWQLDLGDLILIGLGQNHIRSGAILFGIGFGLYREIQAIMGKSANKMIENWGVNWQNLWNFFSILIVVALIISIVTSLIRTIVRYYNLKFVQTGRGFRVEAGLFTRREQAATLPKIQYIRWSAHPLERFFQVFAVHLYQAGGYDMSGKQALHAPGCRTQQLQIIREAYFEDTNVENWTWHHPTRSLFIGRFFWFGVFPFLFLLAKTILDFHWIWLIISALWLPLTWFYQHKYARKRAYGLHADGLWIKSGFFTENDTLLRWNNVKSVRLSQSWLQIRRGGADLEFTTSSGEVTIDYLALETAKQLRDYVLYTLEATEGEK